MTFGNGFAFSSDHIFFKPSIQIMKRLTTITTICAFAILVACSSAKNTTQAQSIIEQYGKTEQLTDSFLHKLQLENDIVLASAIENTAWSKNTTYQIIARKNGAWKGYTYKVNAFNRQPPQTGTVDVAKDACEAIASSFEQPGIWKNKSESAKMACNVTINDGLTWHLLIISSSKVLRSTYYEPQFYQEHCPDADRQLFLDASNRMKEVFGKKAAGQ